MEIKEKKDQHNFSSLTFSDFKKMAKNEALTLAEKVGFPKHYREGREDEIFNDILLKLNNLNKNNQLVIDIGCGCSQLTHKLINLCEERHHKLIFIDSEEMLSHLPDKEFIIKVPGFYPKDFQEFIMQYKQKVDVILTYSVFQYIFTEANPFQFLDQTVSLLKDGGQILIGDIPNSSKRKRFLISKSGLEFHHQNYDPSSQPDVKFFHIEYEQLDDGAILGFMYRLRNAGFDVYLVPQNHNLPMANRREDLLILKP